MLFNMNWMGLNIYMNYYMLIIIILACSFGTFGRSERAF